MTNQVNSIPKHKNRDEFVLLIVGLLGGFLITLILMNMGIIGLSKGASAPTPSQSSSVIIDQVMPGDSIYKKIEILAVEPGKDGIFRMWASSNNDPSEVYRVYCTDQQYMINAIQKVFPSDHNANVEVSIMYTLPDKGSSLSNCSGYKQAVGYQIQLVDVYYPDKNVPHIFNGTTSEITPEITPDSNP